MDFRILEFQIFHFSFIKEIPQQEAGSKAFVGLYFLEVFFQPFISCLLSNSIKVHTFSLPHTNAQMTQNIKMTTP